MQTLTTLGDKVKPFFGDTKILYVVMSSLSGIIEGTIFAFIYFMEKQNSSLCGVYCHRKPPSHVPLTRQFTFWIVVPAGHGRRPEGGATGSANSLAQLQVHPDARTAPTAACSCKPSSRARRHSSW